MQLRAGLPESFVVQIQLFNKYKILFIAEYFKTIVMSTSRISEDWEDYDNRKIRDQRDRSKFSCDEPWEVDYLVKKIRAKFPALSEQTIRTAVSECCKTVPAPRLRPQFLECVMKRLGL